MEFSIIKKIWNLDHHVYDFEFHLKLGTYEAWISGYLENNNLHFRIEKLYPVQPGDLLPVLSAFVVREEYYIEKFLEFHGEG